MLNPYNEKEFIGDKLSIVDIKARDTQNQLFQVEIQMLAYPYLPARMLYNWSQIYSSQLKEGHQYEELNATISIWLLAENLFKDSETAHHHFQLADLKQQKALNDHCQIHVLELNKWPSAPIMTNEDQWMLFFRNSQHWEELPTTLNLPELQQAMSTLRKFSEKERDYLLYLSRQDAIRDEKTKQHLFEKAIKMREEAEREIKEAKRESEEAKRESEVAKRESEEAKRESEEAKRESEEAKRESEEAKRESEEAKRESEEAKRESEEAKRENEEALMEVDKLTAALKKAGIDPNSI